ncbi:hypothetical protein [Acetivibrio clariflavus]|uniref:Uncharacterized protein n=1 Tax=Acetivibrio clariflavus (strain DSM 19732 / NBRC 101661 / EBR45) TaxID=720554 RepID=G8M078_ACECE|nr:hypothetical protein [Acetivibrio clariflavus]AEV66885.1 hypothetical protein Clocl_0133 [Acetivibrio clariflavus DSM 19732]
MPKCSYYGNEAKQRMVLNTYSGVSKDNLQFYYCNEEHKREIEKFAEYVNKNGMKFIILMLIDLLVLTIAVPVGFALKNIYVNAVLTIIPLVILGFLINKYPFATPDTNRKLGIKKAVKITKIMGKVITIGAILAGVVLVILEFLPK